MIGLLGASNRRGSASEVWRARGRGAALGALTVAVAVTGLYVAGAFPRDAAFDPAARTQELHDYLDQLEPLAREGGRVVAHGMKAGVGDIGQSRYGDDVLRSMADGWGDQLRALRTDLAAVEAPVALHDAHALLLEAFDGYVATAGLLADAARAPQAERPALADQAASLGEATDDVWDRAAALVQAEARALGLERIPWLSDEEDDRGEL